MDSVNDEIIDGMVFGSARDKIPALLEAMDGVLTSVQKRLVRYL